MDRSSRAAVWETNHHRDHGDRREPAGHRGALADAFGMTRVREIATDKIAGASCKCPGEKRLASSKNYGSVPEINPLPPLAPRPVWTRKTTSGPLVSCEVTLRKASS